MTASPVDSRKDIVKVAEDLEVLLQSKIVTTTDLSVFEFAPRAKDAKWVYPPSNVEHETELSSALEPLCGFVEHLKSYFQFARSASKFLGAWASGKMWTYALKHSEHELTKFIRKYEQSTAYSQMTDIVHREAAIDSIREAFAVVQRHNFAVPKVDADRDLSPKVRKLYTELRDRFLADATTRSITFVEERLTAYLLRDLFEELYLPNLRPGVLVGNAQPEKEGGTYKNQETVMDDFRTGRVNCIFATSVAEEGIDIPQCNLVIRFDLYKTPIQYMQSRGRARMENSIYAHMIEEGNPSQDADVNFAIEQDEYIRMFCQQLPPDRLLGQGSKLKQLMAKDASCQSFITSTGVLGNYANSRLLLTRYVDSLRLEKFGARPKHSEVYQEIIDVENEEKDTDKVMLFQYKIILPVTNGKL